MSGSSSLDVVSIQICPPPPVGLWDLFSLVLYLFTSFRGEIDTQQK
jgi:hypothetical protein